MPKLSMQDNWETSGESCFTKDKFKSVVSGTSGFEWVNEGTADSPKWGMVGSKVNDWITVKINAMGASIKYYKEAVHCVQVFSTVD